MHPPCLPSCGSFPAQRNNARRTRLPTFVIWGVGMCALNVLLLLVFVRGAGDVKGLREEGSGCTVQKASAAVPRKPLRSLSVKENPAPKK